MTRRTELQHRVAEFKARTQARVANRLFSFKTTGLDGWIKRRILKERRRF